MNDEGDPKRIDPHPGPAGGWESIKAVESALLGEGRAVSGNAIILKQNKPDGFACVSCAWAKPADPRPFEFCENGVKATAWELTEKRATPEFFDLHTVGELRSWSDHDLEDAGRLTHPMRWDAATDKYRAVTWDDAFREIGRELRAVDPRAVVLYCSGRASLEASYMWALFARMLGTNNLPDSSNMCHESTSVALPDSIGVPVGTVSAAAVLGRANAVMGIYGMGITQHRKGVEAVQMIVNMLLLRGSIGKPGAGICPVRGHSNVQGQRTVGITEKPHLVPLDRLSEQYHFEPPRWKGRNTVESCEGILNGDVRAFVALGGNFIRAVPDTTLMEPAWSKLRLTVQISTKLNRSHLVHGEISYVLPCLGRIEIDAQASGVQAVSVEDSTAMIHGSKGVATPASPHLLSEPAIIAGLAKATLPHNPHVPWDEWVGNYDRIREAIGRTYPDTFRDFTARMFTPGGFPRPLAARHRQWKTPTG
jgi:anaerobic selenocysteine-containing dehydrogenase